jgi:hypothetical protein
MLSFSNNASFNQIFCPASQAADIESEKQAQFEEKLERIMKDPQFKSDLHDHCRFLIKEDPAQPEHIAALNAVRNDLASTVELLTDGESALFDHIKDITILDLMAAELSKTSIAENFARSVIDDY